VRRIGWLTPNPQDIAQPDIDAVAARLTTLGYAVGRDVLIDARFADRRIERLATLAREVVAQQPEVIVAAGNAACLALMQVTRTIPIVIANANSPVESGLVTSLARPGGNVTGTTYNQLEIAGKAVEVLKVAAPRLRRVTIIWNPDGPGIQPYKPYADRAARALGVTLHYLDVRRAEDFRLDALARTRAEALYVVPDTSVIANFSALIRFAQERKLPSIAFSQVFVRAGGLLALTPDLRELNQNVAEYLDRILKGVKPADLPIREPARFQLIINRMTANTIGLAIPDELLVRADEVLQ
jgi:putative ABC transport system substrate-binding protein